MTNKNKNILLGVLIVGVLSMTVAFAALSTRLNIQGTTNVAATKWNIHFDNWEKVNIPNAAGHTNTATSPTVSELESQHMSQSPNITKVDGINVVLNQPGDTAKYTFEIVNEGTIDGKLSNFTVTDTSQNALVDYDVKCYADSSREGTAITTNHVLIANTGRVYCYLQVSYKDQENSHTAGSNQVYHQDSISTNVSASWTWVQNDGASSPATSSTPEPSTPVTDSWDKYYMYDSNALGAAELPFDNNWVVWGQSNTSTGTTQVCGKIAGTTKCYENNSTGHADCFHDNSGNITVSGYVADVKAELEGLNYSCTLYASELSCSNNNDDIIVSIANGGPLSVIDNDSGIYCAHELDGQITCAY